MKRLKFLIIPALCAAAVFLLLRFVFLIGYVPTESMEPTLERTALFWEAASMENSLQEISSYLSMRDS